MKTRVMLVDDHAVVRMGFRLLLQATDDIEVVAEAETGEAAYQRYSEVSPDVVVMDIAMPGMGGIEACLLCTSPSPRDRTRYRMPSSA